MDATSIFMDELSKIAKKEDESKGISLSGHVGKGALIGGGAGAGMEVAATPIQLALAHKLRQDRDYERYIPSSKKILAYKLLNVPISGGIGAGLGAGVGAATYGIRRLLGAKKKKD